LAGVWQFVRRLLDLLEMGVSFSDHSVNSGQFDHLENMAIALTG
jgi:hypothetical protein